MSDQNDLRDRLMVSEKERHAVYTESLQLREAMGNLIERTKRAERAKHDAVDRLLRLARTLGVDRPEIDTAPEKATKLAKQLVKCSKLLDLVREMGPVVATMSKTELEVHFNGRAKRIFLPVIVMTDQCASKLGKLAEAWNDVLEAS